MTAVVSLVKRRPDPIVNPPSVMHLSREWRADGREWAVIGYDTDPPALARWVVQTGRANSEVPGADDGATAGRYMVTSGEGALSIGRFASDTDAVEWTRVEGYR